MYVVAMQDITPILNQAFAHHQAGRLESAMAGYRQVLNLDPDNVAALANLGNALCQMGGAAEAEALFHRAQALAPGDVEMHNNLGTAFYEQGKLAAAEASFRQALTLQPRHAEALSNLGSVLFSMGRLDDAVAQFHAALAIKPEAQGTLLNLGTLLWQLGKPAEAEAYYRRVLKITPGNGDVLDRLAAVLLAQDDIQQALDTLRSSMYLRETPQNRALFVDIVRPLRWNTDNEGVRGLLTRALAEPWARPTGLVPTAITMIKQGPITGPLIAKAATAWPQFSPELFGKTELAALDADKLLLALLVTAQNIDLPLERFLTMARRALLENQTEEGLAFRCALARQCFINEYVFFQSAEEIAAAEKLRAGLAASLESGETISPSAVAAVASYFPLSSLPRLVERQWPAPVTALVTQQIAEPAQERKLAAALPAITPMDDAVSQMVRGQYEENPYPRWVKSAPPHIQDTIAGYLRRQFPMAVFARESQNQDAFLSAGCGTGLMALEFARNIRAQILAVDLSLASLGYASRKCAELGLGNIRFAQADLQKIEGRFDVIESCGVLHHMADPFGAWRHLLGLLTPGGFMMVGLYSEAARRGVVRLREYIAKNNYGSSPEEIRRFRQDILALPDDSEITRVICAPDFFGISMCRDLLFHVQEQRTTLAEIGTFLKDNNLVLLGFELDGGAMADYRKRFPDDSAATNLDNWQAFEADHPQTFIGMYNFWVQKPA
jgi:Tfp pilus assembly protein PilF/SAM-dependent methyltransferase